MMVDVKEMLYAGGRTFTDILALLAIMINFVCQLVGS